MSTPTVREVEVARAPRYQKLSHPWNRGYPNNRRIQAAEQAMERGSCAMCQETKARQHTGSGIPLCAACLREWAG